MIPIVTPPEMAAIDAASAESVDELIARAGSAVAWAARQVLGGVYGRRIVVLAGKGNNGADGVVAASRLRAWGARVDVVDPFSTSQVDPCDLVVDAALGTGLNRAFEPPRVVSPVLAVDIPSGVDGLTGAVDGRALSASQTVTFQALKPGLLMHPGCGHAGRVNVVDIGLDVSHVRCHLVETKDLFGWLPPRRPDRHKWHAACWVLAGSDEMAGAAWLAASAAARSGAGYVRLSTPGSESPMAPVEVVSHLLPESGWGAALDDIERFGSVVIGPGLGRGDSVREEVRRGLRLTPVPVVVDADALWALGDRFDTVAGRGAETVLTPHDGEFEHLTGSRPGSDRIEAARGLARKIGAVVLLKGPTTVVASPVGDVLVVNSGDARLATAGTGDVLAGVIGALLARGVPAFQAAAAGAHIHGQASALAPAQSMVASDLLPLLGEVFDATDLG
ncbi:MAG: NAD(P)H-hydrate dehydratase [Acidimicrobiales bacterium]